MDDEAAFPIRVFELQLCSYLRCEDERCSVGKERHFADSNSLALLLNCFVESVHLLNIELRTKCLVALKQFSVGTGKL